MHAEHFLLRPPEKLIVNGSSKGEICPNIVLINHRPKYAQKKNMNMGVCHMSREFEQERKYG
jgi:hypothetical protein